MLDSLELLESEIHNEFNGTDSRDVYLILRHDMNHKVIFHPQSHNFTWKLLLMLVAFYFFFFNVEQFE